MIECDSNPIRHRFSLRLIGTVGLALLLLVGIGVGLVRLPAASSTLHWDAIRRLVEPRAGWRISPLPIAASEELRNHVADVLAYDDALYYQIDADGYSLEVFATYWRPGRVPVKDVEAHVPDICWVQNGWRMSRIGEVRLGEAQGGQVREFELGSEKRHVLYWHLTNAGVITYQTGRGVAWWSAIAEMSVRRLRLKPEQLFLRVSSSQPFGELFSRPIGCELLRSLQLAKGEPGE